jgi:predicted transposase YbfD/YdcC
MHRDHRCHGNATGHCHSDYRAKRRLCAGARREPGNLYENVEDTFRLAQKEQFRGIESHFQETIDKAHGRLEIRKYWLIDDLEQLSYLDEDGKWKGLQAIGIVESERHVGQQVERKRQYYLLSFGGDGQRFASSVPSHWDIENRVHWMLDVAFRENESRIRSGDTPQNLAVLRHLALNLLRQEKTAKIGSKRKPQSGLESAVSLTGS